MAEAQGTTPEPRQYLSPLFGWRGAITESGLNASDRLVAFSLSLHMNERGGSCFPSVPTLARESGLSERSIYRSLARLEDGGWLVVAHGKGGRGRSNLYTAVVPNNPASVAGATKRNPDTRSVNPDTVSRNPDTDDTLGRQESDTRSLGVVCEKCEGTGWLYVDDGVSPCVCRGFSV